MDDALLVRGVQSLCNLFRNGQRFVDRDRPTRNSIGERLAFDKLHDQRWVVPDRSRP
jgi:hypothetical protein